MQKYQIQVGIFSKHNLIILILNKIYYFLYHQFSLTAIVVFSEFKCVEYPQIHHYECLSCAESYGYKVIVCPVCARYCHNGHSIQKYENGKECGCIHKNPCEKKDVSNSITSSETQMEYSKIWSLIPGPEPEMRTLDRKGPRERSFLAQILQQRDSSFSVESATNQTIQLRS